jgi:hypothetical protein
LADGFEEEAVVILGLLRQAGLHVKSVGLTSRPIGSTHGIGFIPDLVLTDLDCSVRLASVQAIILPNNASSLDKLATDPRVHRLLRQVAAQRGQIVTGRQGLRVVRAAAIWDGLTERPDDDRWLPVLLREPGQSLGAFVQQLVQRLKSRGVQT